MVQHQKVESQKLKSDKAQKSEFDSNGWEPGCVPWIELA